MKPKHQNTQINQHLTPNISCEFFYSIKLDKILITLEGISTFFSSYIEFTKA